GRTYAEILDGLLDRIQEAFGDEQTEWIGFKQTWSEAFIASFLNTWPDAKCIHIIRDPRAVLASWKRSSVLSHDYPALMILRHWRKSAALASLYSRRYENHRIVRFEDFTQAPEEQMRKICEFCGLPFDEKTIDAAHFRSGSGSQWTSNTSYQVEEQGISKQYISAWKDRLSDEELQFVEDLCGLEMERMGYARETGGSDPGSILHPPCITRQVQAQVEWVNKFAAEYDLNSANQAKELCRWLLHRHRLEYNSTLSREDLRRIFIDPDLLS
ncbi:MAG: sulfotransferase family protein, partial [Candidatus Hinthialibacter sp.]